MTMPQWHYYPRRFRFSKRTHWIAGNICFVVLFCHYLKTIVRTTNIILFKSSSVGIDIDSDRADGIVEVHGDVVSAKIHGGADYTTKPPFHNKNTNDSLRVGGTKDAILEKEIYNTNEYSMNVNNTFAENNQVKKKLSFYILSSPDITTTLNRAINGTKSDLLAMASDYYQNALNEESAEMWLHRGFERLPARITGSSKEADVYIVVGYCHLFSGVMSNNNLIPQEQQRRLKRYRKKADRQKDAQNQTIAESYVVPSISWADIVPELYRNIVIDATKPHLILIPTWNPEVSRRIGLHSIIRELQLRGVADSNLWSVGFERNPHWQPVPLVSRILPIPYVVNMKRQLGREEEIGNSTVFSVVSTNSETQLSSRGQHLVEESINTKRNENSVFYVGDPRRNANNWAGCSRSSLIEAIQNQQTNGYTNVSMYLRLVRKSDRLNETTYRRLVQSSEYCLVLCGDTPSSRTLTSAIVEGCIPVRVGSRLRGFCDLPCHEGFGWSVTGPHNSHLPYEDRIPWHIFPEIDEAALLNGNHSDGNQMPNKPLSSLKSMFQIYNALEKNRLHAIMNEVRPGFIYGYGDPIFSQDIGQAASYVWESFTAAVQGKMEKD